MRVWALEASVALVKHIFKEPDGSISKLPYANAYEFRSHVSEISDVEQFFQLVNRHAAHGHCLLKGRLNRPLNWESRAGSTDSEDDTEWVCLDFDGAPFDTPDAALAALGIPDVSYVVQWSASQGIAPGLRCHIFFLLSKPIAAPLLKRWLMWLNFQTPQLAASLALTRSYVALLWALDITTCQNDKLIYVGGPTFKGVDDPFAAIPRIQLVEKDKARLDLDPSKIPDMATIKVALDTKINDLRAAKGLPKRELALKTGKEGVAYMPAPSERRVSELKRERGFVYLNLDGGDSWGYWYPENNPEYIYNFKGEPIYRTAELLPSFWAKLQEETHSGVPDSNGHVFLAFRDFKSSQYYNCTYDTETNVLDIAPAKSEKQLRDFMKQHGKVLGPVIYDYNLIFEPSSTTVIDTKNKTVNIWVPSPIMSARVPGKTNKLPPTVAKLIEHVLGGSVECISHWNNWVAAILQFYVPTRTAWVQQGTQGTGKGLLFHQVLTPIFGARNVHAMRMEELESEFTGALENKLLINVDEIQTSSSLVSSRITARLKNLIVEPTISIRKMHQLPYNAKNFCNFIFSSNMPDPVDIAPDDRRFNVAPYQSLPIKMTRDEVMVKLPQELADIYDFWMNWPVDIDRAGTPLDNEARSTLIETSMQTIDKVTDALRRGDLRFFWDQLPSDLSQVGGLTPRDLLAAKYKELVFRLVDTLERKVTRDDLMILVRYCVGDKIPDAPKKFTTYLKHHRLDVRDIWKDNRTTKGIEVSWHNDHEFLKDAKEQISQLKRK